MRRLIIFLVSLIAVISLKAQVPYFGTTAGQDKLYNYTQLKVFPGHNRTAFYTSFQYGVTKWFDVAMNYNSGSDTNAWGIKLNFYKSKGFNIGVQPMVDFDTKNNYHFVDVNTGLFLNGYLTKHLSYISNTWYTQSEHHPAWEQWTYVGYDIGKVTAMVGEVSDISNNFKTDLVLGTYFPIGKVTAYVWYGNIMSNLDKPKITIGFDYKL